MNRMEGGIKDHTHLPPHGAPTRQDGRDGKPEYRAPMNILAPCPPPPPPPPKHTQVHRGFHPDMELLAHMESLERVRSGWDSLHTVPVGKDHLTFHLWKYGSTLADSGRNGYQHSGGGANFMHTPAERGLDRG